MFSPDVSDTSSLLLNAYSDMLKVRNYGSICSSLRISKPGDVDPTWLTAVRHRISMLDDAMDSFAAKHPDIFSDILYPFINYQTLFSAFAENCKSFKGKDEWIQALYALKEALSGAVAQTSRANQDFTDQYQAVSKIQPLLDQSIQAGWQELASEEQEMIKIATALGGLQQAVQDLSGELTASDIRNGKSYVQSSVTISYNIVMSAELSVPYLSFAALVFTVGYSVYDVLSNSEKIQKYWGEINDLENKSTAQAQAAAATKATIQMLGDLEKYFLSIDSSLPRISQMWKEEEQKIVDAVNALNAGADPKLHFDLQTMGIADKSWKSLFDIASRLKQPLTTGKPVTIDTNKPTVLA